MDDELLDEIVRSRVTRTKGWNELSPAEKEKAFAVVKKQKEKEFAKATKSMERIIASKKEANSLIIGVILGISGGMVASVIDHWFSSLGTIYDISVFVIFLLIVGLVIHSDRKYRTELIESTDVLRHITEK